MFLASIRAKNKWKLSIKRDPSPEEGTPYLTVKNKSESGLRPVKKTTLVEISRKKELRSSLALTKER